MGNSLPKLFTKAENDTRVVMVGLDAAGKTTILYKLKLGEIVTAIPTIGFNVETVEYKNVNFTVWDTGGRSRIRALERFYFSDLNAMIFVVDSNDRDRMESSVQEFYTTLSDFRVPKDERFVPKGNLCILILANKQDLPQAMTAEEVAENFNLYSVRDYPWYVHETCAITGDGLFEGLDWLSDALKLGVNAPKTWTVNGKVPEFAHSRDDGAAATTSSPSDVAADGATDDGAGAGETNVGGGSDGATDDGTSEAVDAEPYDGPSLIQLAMAAENKRTDGLFEESALVEAYGTTLQASIDANGAVEVEAMSDCDDDAVVAAFEEAAAQVDAGQGDEVDWDVFTHAATMRLMYILLSRVEDRNAGRKVAVDRIFEILEKVKTGKHGFFHVTHTYFYIQLVDLAIHLPDELEQVPEAAVSAAAGSGDADGTTTGESADGRAFRGFLTRRLYLLNESLITHYYSRELIFQDETSMSEFVLPDIQGLPSILNFNVGRAE